MYIPKLLNVHSAFIRCTFRRTENRIAQKRERYFEERGTAFRITANRIPKKWEPYSEETGTVFRRTGNRILKNNKPYCEETGTVLRRNGNGIPKKFCQGKKEMQKGHKSKQPGITFAPKGICKRVTP